MNALRVYDSDIKRQPELIELAHELVSEYCGNWDALNALIGEQLDNKTARQALNMLLTSTDRQYDHDRIRAALIRRPDETLRQPPKLHIVKEPRAPLRKVSLNVPIRIKRMYGRPKTKNAVVHIVNHARSKGQWSDESIWDRTTSGHGQQPPRWVFSIYAYWKCGKSSHMQRTAAGLDTGMFMDEPDRKICRKCIEMDNEGR